VTPIVERGKPPEPKAPVASQTMRGEWIHPHRLGRRYFHPLLGVVIRYRGTILSDEGVEMISGVIVDRGRQGFALGGQLVWPLARLREQASDAGQSERAETVDDQAIPF
jgi:hypothetical protein